MELSTRMNEFSQIVLLTSLPSTRALNKPKSMLPGKKDIN